MFESPEGVALALFEEILLRQPLDRLDVPVAAYMLDLYAQCLAAVIGKRQPGGEQTTH